MASLRRYVAAGDWKEPRGYLLSAGAAAAASSNAAVGLVELGGRIAAAAVAAGTGRAAGRGMGMMMVVLLLHQLVRRRGHVLDKVIRRAGGRRVPVTGAGRRRRMEHVMGVVVHLMGSRRMMGGVRGVHIAEELMVRRRVVVVGRPVPGLTRRRGVGQVGGTVLLRVGQCVVVVRHHV